MPITTEPKGPKPPLPGLVKVQVLYEAILSSQTPKAANVMHWSQGSATSVTVAELLTFLGLWKSAWETRFKPYLAGNWQYTGYTATMLDGSGVTASVSSTTAGTGATPAVPPQCAVTVSWRAPFSWRGGRPRTYLPGVPDTALSSVAGSLILSTYSGPLATAAQGFISDASGFTLNGAAGFLGFPSYYSKGAFRSPPLFYAFQSAVVHDRLDSQRRRSGKESTFAVD